MTDPKVDLHHYLQAARDALLWKLDGLSEYGIRRPMTPTGTNLLGLVKHLTGVEIGYFGETFGRSVQVPPWVTDDAEDNVDMWATPDESREYIVGQYRTAWAHADDTIRTLPLDAAGRIPHWPDDRRDVTLHRILVHVIAETHRHAGHADIVRELVDGTVGLRPDNTNLPAADRTWWQSYRTRPRTCGTRSRAVMGRHPAAG